MAAAGALVARPQLSKLVRPSLDTTYPLGTLQDEEMRGILALGQTLAAPEAIPPAEFFEGFVNVATQGQPGMLKEYQRAVVSLNTTAARRFSRSAQFADLPAPERDEVLRTLLWQYPASDQLLRRVEVIVASRDALALRMYVMDPLLAYYYRSPFGWAVVGYRSYPGTPQFDPRAYTRPLGDYVNTAG